VERLAAGAYPIFARLLLSAAPCFVFGFLWSFFQPTGDGVGQARDETVVHTEQSIERQPPATSSPGSKCPSRVGLCRCGGRPRGLPSVSDIRHPDDAKLIRNKGSDQPTSAGGELASRSSIANRRGRAAPEIGCPCVELLRGLAEGLAPLSGYHGVAAGG